MSEWTHPRRASKETILYLVQIEPVLDEFDEGGIDYGDLGGSGGPGGDGNEDDDSVGREQMLDNVLEELKHQTASIMEDRKGSVIAEKIVRRLTPLQLRIVLSRCRGYMISLATNRYSSHVLQTLLSFVGNPIEEELSSDNGAMEGYYVDTAGDESERPDLLRDIILSLVSELSGHWAELVGDISGSHVGRGFLQVLGGLPILTERRGKQSRHAHSIEGAVGPTMATARKHAGMPDGGRNSLSSEKSAIDPEALERWSTPYKHVVPTTFQIALKEATMELRSLPVGKLQGLVCDKFGCPMLVMLLRVYGNLPVDPASGRMPCLEEDSPAMSLATTALQWDSSVRSKEVVYAIAGENTASHFLEAVIWLTPQGFFQELYRRCFEDRLLEYCEHAVSNFLIQAVLQRVEDQSLAEDMVVAILDHAPALLAGKRAGVLWRAAQACLRLGLKPAVQTKLLAAIASALRRGEKEGVSGEGSGDAAAGVVKKKSPPPTASDPFSAARAWVPALLDPRLPGEEGSERLSLNVPGARIVQNVLKFEPTVAAPVLKAVASLPEAVLLAVARDNLGSRCLIDPILYCTGGGGGKGVSRNRPAEDARRTILRAFRGHLVAMACDRVAWHVLLKCFRGGDMKEKRMMAEELAGGGEQSWSRMSGYPSGRAVMTECMVERFSRSPREWDEAFKNRENRAKMLEEILAVGGENGDKRGDAEKRSAEVSGEPSTDDASPPLDAKRAVGEEDGGDDIDDDKEEMGEDDGKSRQRRRRQRGRGRRGKGSEVMADEGEVRDTAEPTTSNDADSSEVTSTIPEKEPRRKLKSKETKSAYGERSTTGEDDAETSASGEEAPKPDAVSERKRKKSKVSSERSPVGGADKAAGPVLKKPTSKQKEEDVSPGLKKKAKIKRKREAAEKSGSDKGTEGDLKADDNADLSFVLDATKKAATVEGSRKPKKGDRAAKVKRSDDATAAEVKLKKDGRRGQAAESDRPSGDRTAAGKEKKALAKQGSGSAKKRKRSSSDTGGFRLF